MQTPPTFEAHTSMIPVPSQPQTLKAARAGSSVGRNAVLTFSSQMASILVAVICMPIILRTLGAPRLGLLAIVWTILGYFSALDLGMGLAVTRAASIALGSGRTERVRTIFWTGVSVQFIVGGIGGLALALSSSLAAKVLHLQPGLSHEASTSFLICCIALPMLLVNSSILGLLQSFQFFKLIALVQIPASIAQFLLPVAIGYFSKSLVPIVGSLLLLRIGSLIVLFASARRHLPHITALAWPSVTEARFLLGFGGWATLGTIVSPFMVYADRFLIGSILSLSAVAYYSVPLDSGMRLLVLASSLATALFPELSYSLGADDAVRANALVAKAIKYTLAIVGIPVVFLMCCGPQLLTLWLGRDFGDKASLVLPILLLGILANSLARVPFALLQAKGRADVTSLLQLAEAPLHFVLCYFLLSTIGLAGAAIAWTMRLVADTLLLFYFAGTFARLSLDGHSKRWVMRFLAFLLCLAIVTYGLMSGLQSPFPKLLFAGVVFLAGAVCAWLRFFSHLERIQILSAVMPKVSGFRPG